MPKEVKKLSLDKEIYKEASAKNLEIAELMEPLDPSENYVGTDLEGLDAYERQLYANGLVVSGKHASLVSDFFSTTNSKILFPEFINRNLLIGMNKGKLEATLNEMLSTTTQIDSGVFKGIALDIDNMDVTYKRVMEKSKFPVLSITTKEKETNIVKIGATIEATYEAMRRTKIDLIGTTMQMIGLQFGRDLVNEAALVLLNGDNNSNPAGNINTATTNAITFEDLLELEFEFENFEGDMIIGNKAAIKKVLKIDEFRHPLIGAALLTQGMPTTPLGNTLRVVKYFPDNKLLQFNRQAGIEMLEEKGASLIETEKIIDGQFEKIVISKVVGFNKIFPDSAYTLTYVWS